MCDVIKQNESELANINFEIKLTKRTNFPCFPKPSIACISESNIPIFTGFLVKHNLFLFYLNEKKMYCSIISNYILFLSPYSIQSCNVFILNIKHCTCFVLV